MENVPESHVRKRAWLLLLPMIAAGLAVVVGFSIYLAWFVVKAVFAVIYGILYLFSERWFN